MTTEVLGPHRREAPTLTPPGPPGYEIDLFDTQNQTAFLVMSNSRKINREKVSQEYGITTLGTINELVGLNRGGYIVFIFNRDTIDVVSRKYRNEPPEVINQLVQDLSDAGYQFLPTGIPSDPETLKQNEKSGGPITKKIVAFRLKPRYQPSELQMPH